MSWALQITCCRACSALCVPVRFLLARVEYNGAPMRFSRAASGLYVCMIYVYVYGFAAHLWKAWTTT